MPQKSLSSLEIAAIVHELQSLVGGIIAKAYHVSEEGKLFLHVHVSNQGKKLLKIVPGKLLCLTSEKESQPSPSGLCQLLRKYLDHAYIQRIRQKDSERIVLIELDRKEKYTLVLELFSPGNAVLLNEQGIILGAQEQRVWKDRSIAVKEKYVFPPPAVNWFELTPSQMQELLKNSEKRNLVTAIATDIGLGGVYAEELCIKSDVNKERVPKEITLPEVKALHKTIQSWLTMIKMPKGYMYEQQFTPFPFTGKDASQVKDSYSEAVDTISPVTIVSPYEKKIQSLQAIIRQQEESVARLEQEAEAHAQKGDAMYEQYSGIQKMLQTVHEERQSKSWHEIAEIIRKQKNIKSIDLKSKKIVLVI